MSVVKTIHLTQDQVTLVDDEDFKRFGNLKWHAHWNEDTKSYYVHGNAPTGGLRGVKTGCGNRPRRTIVLHRAILGVTDPRVKVDHRNHDTLDNRRENLRQATQAQNVSHRSGLDSNNTSGYRGVDWHKKSQKWRARITVRGSVMTLGFFYSIEQAAAAYKDANRKHFGEFGGQL